MRHHEKSSPSLTCLWVSYDTHTDIHTHTQFFTLSTLLSAVGCLEQSGKPFINPSQNTIVGWKVTAENIFQNIIIIEWSLAVC